MGTFHSVLGELSGTLGNYVYRRRNGKVIVCARPKRRTPLSEEAKQRNNLFGLITKISSAIYRNEILKKLWPKQGGFSHIVKINYKGTDPYSQNYFPVIIPTNGFKVRDKKIIFLDRGIRISAGPLELYKIDDSTEKWIAAAGVIILKDPLDVSYPEIIPIMIKSGVMKINLKDPIDISINLVGEDAGTYSKYKKAKASITLVTINGDYVPVQYSEELRGEN